MNKKAFTLGEMMVLMLLMSIVLAASMPLVTKKQTPTGGDFPWEEKDANHIFYGTDKSFQTMIGTGTISSDNNARNAALYINVSSNVKHITFAEGNNVKAYLYADDNGIHFDTQDKKFNGLTVKQVDNSSFQIGNLLFYYSSSSHFGSPVYKIHNVDKACD